MQYADMVRQKLSHTSEERVLKRGSKNQKPTCSHTHRAHKNTKLEVILYTQRTWCRSVQALCMLLRSLWVHVSFGLFHLGGCFLGYLPSLWPFHCFLPSFYLGSLSPGGRDFMETPCLDPSVLRPFFLCIVSGLGLCIYSRLLQEEFRRADSGVQQNVIRSRLFYFYILEQWHLLLP